MFLSVPQTSVFRDRMPNRVARLLAVLAVQPCYLPSKIPFVRRRDFCATNIRRGEERASTEASALEVSGKGQCDADNMDETDDLTRRQDASQYNHAEDARPDLRGISASVAARGCPLWVISGHLRA